MSFKLSDLDVIKTLATQRDDLVRVSRGLDKARTFRVVMGTNESGELSCSLPATFANDVRVVIEKQTSLIEDEMRALGVTP
jgi:hypothetical protein